VTTGARCGRSAAPVDHDEPGGIHTGPDRRLIARRLRGDAAEPREARRPQKKSRDPLLAEVKRLARAECQATARLVASLGVLDARRLYLGEGYPSLFAYCVGVLRLSESAAYHRIEAARAARRFPVLLARLAEGALTLTTVTLLAPHLTAETHAALIEAACHKSKREVEHLLAARYPRPDVPASIRKLPAPMRQPPPSQAPSRQAPDTRGEHGDRAPEVAAPEPTPRLDGRRDEAAESRAETPLLAAGGGRASGGRPAVVAPLAPERYKLQVTISGSTQRKLRRAQDLLRHAIPDGDPAAVCQGRFETGPLGRRWTGPPPPLGMGGLNWPTRGAFA